jgi:hypothetical protein
MSIYPHFTLQSADVYTFTINTLAPLSLAMSRAIESRDPHYRSTPDSTPNNNWCTQGNVNPYIGKPGTHAPEPSDSWFWGQRPTPYSSNPLLNIDSAKKSTTASTGEIGQGVM